MRVHETYVFRNKPVLLVVVQRLGSDVFLCTHLGSGERHKTKNGITMRISVHVAGKSQPLVSSEMNFCHCAPLNRRSVKAPCAYVYVFIKDWGDKAEAQGTFRGPRQVALCQGSHGAHKCLWVSGRAPARSFYRSVTGRAHIYSLNPQRCHCDAFPELNLVWGPHFHDEET